MILFVQTFATMFIRLSRYLLRYSKLQVVNLNYFEPIQFKKVYTNNNITLKNKISTFCTFKIFYEFTLCES